MDQISTGGEHRLSPESLDWLERHLLLLLDLCRPKGKALKRFNMPDETAVISARSISKQKEEFRLKFPSRPPNML